MVRASAQDAPVPRAGPLSPLARLVTLSVNPDVMSVQDAFRTRLALLQGAVPFDVAGARQLLAGTIW